jgi:2-polyprenyl-6-methoxyphenol hydroxylase-like FAD-dependent oxidoreductase
MLSIGDAHACTNPSLGRGMSLGLVHTALMREALRSHLDDPVAMSLALDTATAEHLTRYHTATRDTDRARMAEIRAAIDGRTLEPTPESQIADTMAAATSVDPDALRWFLEIVMCLATPPEILSRPGVFERLVELSAAIPPAEPYGLDRAQLLEMCNT